MRTTAHSAAIAAIATGAAQVSSGKRAGVPSAASRAASGRGRVVAISAYGASSGGGFFDSPQPTSSSYNTTTYEIPETQQSAGYDTAVYGDGSTTSSDGSIDLSNTTSFWGEPQYFVQPAYVEPDSQPPVVEREVDQETASFWDSTSVAPPSSLLEDSLEDLRQTHAELERDFYSLSRQDEDSFIRPKLSVPEWFSSRDLVYVRAYTAWKNHRGWRDSSWDEQDEDWLNATNSVQSELDSGVSETQLYMTFCHEMAAAIKDGHIHILDNEHVRNMLADGVFQLEA